MAATRRNILSMPLADVQRFTAALNALKADGTYDGFVRRHINAMSRATPAGSSRNAAHRGPVFLPWHRAALLELEAALQAVDPAVGGLPYWMWHREAGLNGGDARRSRLWTADYLGGDGDPAQGNRVRTGPFAHWNALVVNNSTGTLAPRSEPGLVRLLARDPAGLPTLPDQAQVNDTIERQSAYDSAPWDGTAAGFRNRVEGWWSGESRMHNQVHRWVGGDMLTGTSPNDPVFWLNHCAVDRLWWIWQGQRGISTYQPVSGGPAGHNLNDPMPFLLTPRTPADVLDVTALGYSYV